MRWTRSDAREPEAETLLNVKARAGKKEADNHEFIPTNDPSAEIRLQLAENGVIGGVAADLLDVDELLELVDEAWTGCGERGLEAFLGAVCSHGEALDAEAGGELDEVHWVLERHREAPLSVKEILSPADSARRHRPPGKHQSR